MDNFGSQVKPTEVDRFVHDSLEKNAAEKDERRHGPDKLRVHFRCTGDLDPFHDWAKAKGQKRAKLLVHQEWQGGDCKDKYSGHFGETRDGKDFIGERAHRKGQKELEWLRRT